MVQRSEKVGLASLTQIRHTHLHWSEGIERRVSLYERYACTVEVRLEQLARERGRGVTPLLAPLPPVCQEEHDFYGTVVCVACQRDHHVEPGLELTTADGGVLCWPCARAGEPMLAAIVLADAAGHAERAGMDVCEMANGFLIDVIRERGYEERAADLGGRVVRIQALLREARRCGDSDPVCWLGGEQWLEQVS